VRPLRDRRRILVVGCPGAGKSVLARKLGEALRLPVIHLDAHFWRPGWEEPPEHEWRVALDRLLSGPSWVMDGNYGSSLERRLESADAVVFLDLPRRICMWRVLMRIATTLGRRRPDSAPGCVERVDWEFLRWVWRFRRDSRPRVARLVDENRDRVETVVLTSTEEVARFLTAVEPEA